MRQKRTEVDFIKHELLIEAKEGLLVHHLKQPGTYINSIKYINTNGIMAVTGDFGNWIFCREFWPSPEGGVSDGYWEGKLRMASTQQPEEWDPEATEEQLKRQLATEEDLSEAETEYLNECINLAQDSEYTYKAYAYSENVGRYEDGEYVVFETKTKYWLQVVFDGFDEICDRLAKQNKMEKEQWELFKSNLKQLLKQLSKHS